MTRINGFKASPRAAIATKFEFIPHRKISFCRVFLMAISILCAACTKAADAPAGDPATEGNSAKKLKFDVEYGKNVELCDRYREMINSAAYQFKPICSREILDKSHRFQPVLWKKIRDMAEIERVAIEGVRTRSKNISMLRPNAADEAWRGMKADIDAGLYEVEMASIDMNGDGITEAVYRFVIDRLPPLQAEECSYRTNYVVIPVREDAQEKYALQGYPDLSGYVQAGLFYFDGRVYMDYWNQDVAGYNLEVHRVSGMNSRICGLNATE